MNEPEHLAHAMPQARDLAPAARHPAPDVVRSIALAGVILMNYHGYLIIRGAPQRDGWFSELFDPWTGVFSTRFAATFVLVAGIGITLMTRSALADPAQTRTLRWRLASRGFVLYASGLAFDVIWPGTILPFYGAMFAVAAMLFTLRTPWIVFTGVAAAIAGWGLMWWIVERSIDDENTRWLTAPGPRSPRGLLLDVTVNGTHPLLPWLAFLCAGMVVGRLLGRSGATRDVIVAGAALLGASLIGRAVLFDAADIRAGVLFSTDPLDRGLLYVASALGTALIAFGSVGWLATRFSDHAAVDALRRAGQVSLSIYVFHALLFLLVVDVLEWITGGIGTALVMAAVVWVVGTMAAARWLVHHERGPIEQVFRSITR